MRTVSYLSRRMRTSCILAALCSPLLGQQTSQPSGGESEEDVVLLSPFEVQSDVAYGYRATNSVSGSRVNLKLQDVPQTISVVTEEFMRDINAFDIDEAVKYTSGVSAASFFGNTFNLRGFQVGNAKLNGFTFPTNSRFDSINTARVEVVKGPAGVLYGVGTPGGVVNIISKRPEKQKRFYMKAGVGDQGAHRVEFDATGPLSGDGRLLYRLTAAYQEQYTTLQYGFRQHIFIAPTLQWIINDRPIPTTLTLSMESQQVPHMVSADERVPQVSRLTPAPYPSRPDRQIQVGYMFVPGLPEDFNFAGPNATREDYGNNIQAVLEHSFADNLRLRVAGLSSEYELERLTQFAASSLQYDNEGNLPATVPVQSFYGYNNYRRQSAQADLNWELETKAGDLNLIFGALSSDAESHIVDYRDYTRPAFNLFNPGPEDYAIKPYPDPAYTRLRDDVTPSSYNAWWAVINAELLKKRLVFLGGYRKEGILDNFQAGFAYRINDSLNFIYSYTESGQGNSQFPDTPQTGRGQEAGFRFNFLEGRLSGNLTAFDIENSNIQRRDPNVGGSVYTLSGLERSYGAEFEVFYNPNDDWRVVFNITRMEPRVESNITAPFTEGVLIDNAPELSTNLYVRRTFNQGALKGAYLALGVNHQSETRPFGSNAGLFLLTQPAFTVANASAGYSFKTAGDYRWSVDLSVKNMFDRFYYVKSAIPANGRSVFGSVSLRF